MILSTQQKILIGVIVFGIAIIVLIALVQNQEEPVPTPPTPIVEEEPEIMWPEKTVIGSSVLGRDIEAYTFGDGERHVLFVGGMHGGYEWNSVLLAYEFIDHLAENRDLVPEGVAVSVVPSANPDGLYKVLGVEGRFALADVPADTGPVGNGRFNANGVDLNRNFDCKWKSESMWRGNAVSAGTAAFSEPEAVAIRDFVLEHNPNAVVFWHSQANAVYASECEEGVLPETSTVMHTYADAAGYTPIASFDAYEVTGDAEGWLASIGIPAITVELATHETIEWTKNLAGAKALIEYYNGPEFTK